MSEENKIGNNAFFYRPYAINGNTEYWDAYDGHIDLFNLLTETYNPYASVTIDDDALIALRTSLRLQSGYRLEDPETQEAWNDYMDTLVNGKSIDKDVIYKYSKEVEDLLRVMCGWTEEESVYVFHVVYDLERYAAMKNKNGRIFEVALERFPKALSDVRMIYANNSGEGLVVSKYPFEVIKNKGVISYDRLVRKAGTQDFEHDAFD